MAPASYVYVIHAPIATGKTATDCPIQETFKYDPECDGAVCQFKDRVSSLIKNPDGTHANLVVIYDVPHSEQPQSTAANPIDFTHPRELRGELLGHTSGTLTWQIHPIGSGQIRATFLDAPVVLARRVEFFPVGVCRTGSTRSQQ